MPTRRAFLRSGAAFAFFGPHRFTRRVLRGELRIMQWAHPTPGYDAWFDERARRWGEAHDARVLVDHVNSAELVGRARAEAAAKKGHDLVQLLVPPTALQLDAAPLDDAVSEVLRRIESPSPVAIGSAHNPKTGRWFAFPTHYVRLELVRRTDLLPAAPRSWQDVLRAAPGLKRRGHPVGIGLADELDSTTASLSLLLAHGGGIDRLASRGTVAYLRFVAELWRSLPPEVLDWTPYSNNQLLLEGRAALIANPRTVLQAPHAGLPLAATPAPDRAVPHTVGCYVLWRFSANAALAQRFLVDLQRDAAADEARSRGVNAPAWVDDGRTVSPTRGNGAVQQLIDSFVLTRTARLVAVGKATAEEAARDAARRAEPVFKDWRDAKLI